MNQLVTSTLKGAIEKEKTVVVVLRQLNALIYMVCIDMYRENAQFQPQYHHKLTIVGASIIMFYPAQLFYLHHPPSTDVSQPNLSLVFIVYCILSVFRNMLEVFLLHAKEN